MNILETALIEYAKNDYVLLLGLLDYVLHERGYIYQLDRIQRIAKKKGISEQLFFQTLKELELGIH